MSPFSRVAALGFALFCAVVTQLGGCQDSPGPFVRLRLGGVQPETTKITLSASLGGTMRNAEFTGTDFSTLTVDFPQSARGDATFEVKAYDQKGCAIGTGTGTVTLKDDAVYEVVIVVTLDAESAKCGYVPVTLSFFKQSQSGVSGSVSSSPAGIDCKKDCSMQSFVFRQGTQVTLTAVPDGNALFSGWSDACAESALQPTCTLTLTQDVSVGAGFKNCTGWCPEGPGGANALYGVWGTSPNSIYAVGEKGTLLNYAGVQWSPVGSGTTKTLRAVGSARGDTNTFAVGDAGTILHLTSSGWVDVTSKSAGVVAGRNIFGLAGTGAARNRLELAIVGDNGLYVKLESSDTFGTFSDLGTTVDKVNLNGVAVATTSDEQFVVGDGGVIVRRNKDVIDTNRFARVKSSTTANLHALWYGGPGNPSDSYAVGDGGVVVKRTGAATADWQVLPQAASTANLRAIWGFNDSATQKLTVYIVGDAGTILSYNGTSFTKMDSRTTANLYGVWGTSATNVYVVGNSGTILHYLP